MNIFEKRESNVRSYCHNFPDIFHRAKGSIIYSESGKEYIDFFAGAGALNYGHNHDYIKQRVISYLDADGIAHGLDMYTSAKEKFLAKFDEAVLSSKKLDYRIQFCGPTGTNAVEAALKLARKVKQRPGIFSFMGAYHGMTLGSLSISGNIGIRAGAIGTSSNVTFMPYPYGFMESFDTIEYIESVLNDVNSGIEKPAAIIFETVQAEGGVIVAPIDWMQRLRKLCDEHDILLICDDIQVGCGRTGSFFSFERADIVPDMVVLSKSISGYGFPMSLLLIKPELDIWEPGEHNGTFRGNQLAFIGATAALEYRESYDFEQDVKAKELFLRNFLNHEIAAMSEKIAIRGIGMIWGIDVKDFGDRTLSQRITSRCFELGLIIEKAGRNDSVIKILPPLTIDMSSLQKGCSIIKAAFDNCISS
ncbi:MAG: diaminobutyrate--2-oxoglutarate transaminase [Nostoc sp. ZfuVER08]|uniref:Diaminobutyrate--2-oxoglutarate transaminase n=1 Tax=Nostoc punctiforme FACHB-252 TaxID=1357509 RepID=A0ABR8H8J7_NOSPU|nr:diaminobutyrate--2-oxoglutarate transaminase [Nostoc punctiforme]MBD2611723.1 diaminobutyrate--2-oxoglutarate transaminase [Nostoc punctiforme FACHB-252]MBL1201281.1 diaminobutyrate--2-oxoglutarate transaminase [Nostoc sp. GBBB01]MDZ8015592.1 diaminobutyrate--2-oxoglutarate transaminase [Nostoc sp. ZfuVER08]